MTAFFIPGADSSEDAEMVLASIARFVQRPVPPPHERICRVAYTHNGEHYTAEVGQPVDPYYRTEGPIVAILGGNPLLICTPTPAGRALFGMLGVFSEFEREMIAARVNAGLARVKEKFDRGEKHESKAGNLVRRFGRPGAKPEQIEEARQELAKGAGILKVAKLVGLGTGTVHRLAKEMRGTA